MALSGRSSRRGAGRRWLVLGVVVTLVVVLIDASIKSRSQAPARQLAGQEWVDRAYNLVGSSNVAGKDLAGLLSSSGTVTAATTASELADMKSVTVGAYKTFRTLDPPGDLAAASGLLDACLLVRSEAMASISSAVNSELSSPASSATTSAAASLLASDIQKLQVADQAYKLFAAAVPASLHAPAPASAWITSDSGDTAATLTVFLGGLHSRVSLTPINQVTIEAVSTTPSALTTRSGVEILTPSAGLTVNVVVGNTGNKTETGLTVNASVAPATATGTGSARNFVDSLAPSAAQAVSIGDLNPAQGSKVTLTVTVTGATGSGVATQTKTLTFEMPLPTSSSSTTTTTTTTTTVPAG